MSLVKISDFSTDTVSGLVMALLSDIGFTTVLKTSGYIVTAFGDQENTPVGYINDTVNSNTITFERNQYVGGVNDVNFVSDTGYIDIESAGYKDIMNKFILDDYKFNVLMGVRYSNTKGIMVESKSKTVWYYDKISIGFKRLRNESNEDYAIRICGILMKTIGR